VFAELETCNYSKHVLGGCAWTYPYADVLWLSAQLENVLHIGTAQKTRWFL